MTTHSSSSPHADRKDHGTWVSTQLTWNRLQYPQLLLNPRTDVERNEKSLSQTRRLPGQCLVNHFDELHLQNPQKTRRSNSVFVQTPPIHQENERGRVPRSAKTLKGEDSNSRESNSGHIDGNDVFYNLTTDAERRDVYRDFKLSMCSWITVKVQFDHFVIELQRNEVDVVLVVLKPARSLAVVDFHAVQAL